MVRLNKVLQEPWRCECTNCGSYAIVRLTGGKRRRDKDYSPFNARQAEKDRTYRWRCDNCSKRLRRVYDNKQQESVAIDSLVKYDGPIVKPKRV